MFEGLIATVLNRVLGEYVTNLEHNQLKLGIWSGDVVLKNLNVRQDALERLGLPILVREGTLTELILKIPWQALRTQPVQIFIKGIHIIAAPSRGYEYDQKAEEDKAYEVKMEKLEAMESIRLMQPTTTGEGDIDQKNDGSFMEQLITKIVDNIQLKVENVHIRYEDVESWSSNPFALGFQLTSLRAVSSDSNWNESFIQVAGDSVRKLLSVNGLSIYFADRLQPFDDPEGVDYVLEPVKGIGKIIVNRVVVKDTPKITGTVEFGQFALTIWDLFYGAALRSGTWFQRMLQAKKYRKFRPTDYSRPDTDPLQWWRYAITAVLSEVSQKRREWSWENMKNRRDDRRTYIRLYLKRKRVEELSHEEADQMISLERKLDLEDLKRYRAMARTQLRREKVDKDIEEGKMKKSSHSSGGGLLSWFWSSPAPEEIDATEGNLTEDQLKDLEEERKRLYNAIEYDEKSYISASEVPPDAALMSIKFVLSKGSMGLKQKPKDRFSDAKPKHINVGFHKLHGRLESRKDDSFKLALGLLSLDIVDGFSLDSVHSTIVRPRRVEGREAPKMLRDGLEEEKDDLDEDSFFRLIYEAYAPSRQGSVVGCLNVTSQPLEVFANLQVIDRVTEFLKPPTGVLNSALANAIVEAAQETLQSWSNATRLSLEFALERHKSIDLKVHVEAPIFYLPERFDTTDCPLIMLDTGQIDIHTELVPEAKKKELQNKDGVQISAEEMQQLANLMYDKFHIRFSSVQVMVAPSLEYCQHFLETNAEGHSPYHVLDKTHLEFILANSILPQAADIAKVRISGTLPTMKWHLSDWHYRSGMKIMDKVQTDLSGKNSVVAQVEEDAMQVDSPSSAKSQTSATTDDQKAASTQRDSQKSLQRSDTVTREKTDPINVQFDFEITELMGTLARFKNSQSGSMSTARVIPMISTTFRKVGFSMTQRQSGKMDIRTFINFVQLRDYCSPESDQTWDIIRAETGEKDLVDLQFSMGPNRPKMVEASLSSLTINFEKDALFEIQDFIQSLIGGPSRDVKSPTTPASGTPNRAFASLDRAAIGGTATAMGASEKNTLFDRIQASGIDISNTAIVTLVLDKITVNIIERDAVFLELALGQSESRVVALMKEDDLDLDVTGQVGQLELKYCSSLDPRRPLNRSWQVLSIEGDELGRFSFAMFGQDRRKEQDIPDLYQGEISLKTGAPRFRYNPDMIDDVTNWANALSELFVGSVPSRPASRNATDGSISGSESTTAEDDVGPAVAAAAMVAGIVEPLDAQQTETKRTPMARYKIHVHISSPIIVLPNPSLFSFPFTDSCDELCMYPGEVLFDSKSSPTESGFAHGMDFSLNRIRLESVWRAQGAAGMRTRYMKMLEDVDIAVAVEFSESVSSDGTAVVENTGAMAGPEKRPAIRVSVNVADVSVKVIERQYLFVAQWVKMFELRAPPPEEPQESAAHPPKDWRVKKARETRKQKKRSKTRSSEVAARAQSSRDIYPTLDLSFKLGKVSMELFTGDMSDVIFDESQFGNEAHLVSAPAKTSLGEFSINDVEFNMCFRSDTSYVAELTVCSFNLFDTRPPDVAGEFKDILTTDLARDHQLQVHVIGGGATPTPKLSVTFDSPRVTVALNFLFAILGYAARPWSVVSKVTQIEGQSMSTVAVGESTQSVRTGSGGVRTRRTRAPEPKRDKTSRTKTNQKTRKSTSTAEQAMTITATLVNPRVVVLEDAHKSDSQGIVLEMRTACIKQSSTLTAFAIERLAITLSPNMQAFSRHGSAKTGDDIGGMRLVQPVDLTFELMGNERTNVYRGSIDLGLLDVRLSSKDILMFSNLINKAIVLTQDEMQSMEKAQQSMVDLVDEAKSKEQQAKQVAKVRLQNAPREDLRVRWKGFRFALVNDLSEIQVPLVRAYGTRVEAQVKNWSSALSVESAFGLQAESFNLRISQWEPLLEQWYGQVRVDQNAADAHMAVKVASKEMMDINISHTFVETMLMVVDSFSNPSRPRVGAANVEPHSYVIENRSGVAVSLWSEAGLADGSDIQIYSIPENESIPWGFDDFQAMRDCNSPQSHRICLQFNGQPFESLRGINIDREGLFVFNLRPKGDHLHQVVLDIKLYKRVMKKVIIRSPLVLVNHTKMPLEVTFVGYRGNREVGGRDRIHPDLTETPVPLDICYRAGFHVRPEEEFMYGWNDAQLSWKKLADAKMATLTCRPGDGTRQAFRICVQCVDDTFDNKAPPSTFNPTKIHFFPPFEIENLLPYEIRFLVRDEITRHEERGSLPEADCLPIHIFDLNHKLGLSISVPGEGFKTTGLALIYDPEDDYEDDQITLIDKSGRKLSLRLYVQYHPNGGGARRITIFSPYVLVNNVGLNMLFKEKSLLERGRLAAGQGSFVGDEQRSRPFMYSYAQSFNIRNRTVVKVGDSQFSKPVSFEAIGSEFEVAIPMMAGQEEVFIGVSVREVPGKYRFSKTVMFTPRFILRNNLDSGIVARQNGTDRKYDIIATEQAPLHFFTSSKSKTIRFKLRDFDQSGSPTDNGWSAALDVTTLGQWHIKLPIPGASFKLLKIVVMIEGATIFIVVDEETSRWPYRIENQSDYDIQVYQRDTDVAYVVETDRMIDYAWEEPCLSSPTLIVKVHERQAAVNLTEIGPSKPLTFELPHTSEQRAISMEVYADGSVIALHISNYEESHSVFRRKRLTRHQNLPRRTTEDDSDKFELVDIEAKTTFSVDLHLAGIGISLVAKSSHEILYMSFQDIDLSYKDKTLYNSIKLVVRWLQVDNQMYNAVEPLLIYPTTIPKSGTDKDGNPSPPVFQTVLVQSKDSSHGLTYFNHFNTLLQELTVAIDEDFVYALIDFARFAVPTGQVQRSQTWDDISKMNDPRIISEGSQFYFEAFVLQPIILNLSFVRTTQEKGKGLISVDDPFMFIFDVMAMGIANIHDAPIKLHALVMEHAIASSNVLADRIGRHYQSGIMTQLHKVIGSADFMGNPVGLFNSFTSGVYDLFYEPYQGLISERPQDVGLGLAKGTTNFVRKTVFGLANTATKITGSVSKGLTAATFDHEFQQKHQMNRARNKPAHAVYGLTGGSKSFVESVASGIRGVVEKPIEGAEKQGFEGFFKGLGKGIVGAVTKPAVGVFDFASQVTEGIRNTTTMFDDKTLVRQRLPRHVGRERVLRGYNPVEAQGAQWLRLVDHGRYSNSTYVYHVDTLQEDLVCLISSERVILMRKQTLKSEWKISLNHIKRVEGQTTMVVIYVKDGDYHVVPSPDELGARDFEAKLKDVTTNYVKENAEV